MKVKNARSVVFLADGLFTLSIDVEDWYHHPSVCGSPFSKYKNTKEFFSQWTDRYDYITGPTMRILDLLSELGIRATFFILSDIAEKYNGLVKAIKRKGHEIAGHGFDHRCYIHPSTGRQIASNKEFRSNMAHAKGLLERTANQQITGFRVPGAFVAGWMLDILEDLGYEYDSSVSVNSLYNKTDSSLMGVGRIAYHPASGSLLPGAPREIVEIPWPFYKLGPLKVPVGGGPLLRYFGSRLIYQGLKQSLRTGFTTLYLHPLDICEEKLPTHFSMNRPLFWLFKGKIVENRLRWILSKLNVDYITMNEFNKAWRRESGNVRA